MEAIIEGESITHPTLSRPAITDTLPSSHPSTTLKRFNTPPTSVATSHIAYVHAPQGSLALGHNTEIEHALTLPTPTWWRVPLGTTLGDSHTRQDHEVNTRSARVAELDSQVYPLPTPSRSLPSEWPLRGPPMASSVSRLSESIVGCAPPGSQEVRDRAVPHTLSVYMALLYLPLFEGSRRWVSVANVKTQERCGDAQDTEALAIPRRPPCYAPPHAQRAGDKAVVHPLSVYASLFHLSHFSERSEVGKRSTRRGPRPEPGEESEYVRSPPWAPQSLTNAPRGPPFTLQALPGLPITTRLHRYSPGKMKESTIQVLGRDFLLSLHEKRPLEVGRYYVGRARRYDSIRRYADHCRSPRSLATVQITNAVRSALTIPPLSESARPHPSYPAKAGRYVAFAGGGQAFIARSMNGGLEELEFDPKMDWMVHAWDRPTAVVETPRAHSSSNLALSSSVFQPCRRCPSVSNVINVDGECDRHSVVEEPRADSLSSAFWIILYKYWRSVQALALSASWNKRLVVSHVIQDGRSLKLPTIRYPPPCVYDAALSPNILSSSEVAKRPKELQVPSEQRQRRGWYASLASRPLGALENGNASG
ncbi:hypothetical protein NMY22_g6563 [Coprinellus aureogranulatus]|nr:hypothetical protein NMY22_g6563 [Coprinellus aureogranulatus]